MHPRNGYAAPLDLGALARADARLAPFVHESRGEAQVNWDDPAALRAVTGALLLRDFSIRATLRDDRLCPALPNRLNYVLWIEDIMRALHPIDCASYDEVHGGDIGTGSVAIYACLCCAMHARWTMVGTDVDADALAHAQAMLDENAHVGTRIELRRTSMDAPLLPDGRLHFTLCNPPFYASPEERAALAASKREARRPAEGSHDEMYTPGGEAAFVLRMLDESMLPANRERIVYVA